MATFIKINHGISLVIEECCNCGVIFAFTEELYKRKKKDQGWFYCPNGHGQYYTGKNREQKLKEELESARRGRQYHKDRAEAAKKNARREKQRSAGYKGAFNKLKKATGA